LVEAVPAESDGWEAGAGAGPLLRPAAVGRGLLASGPAWTAIEAKDRAERRQTRGTGSTGGKQVPLRSGHTRLLRHARRWICARAHHWATTPQAPVRWRHVGIFRSHRRSHQTVDLVGWAGSKIRWLTETSGQSLIPEFFRSADFGCPIGPNPGRLSTGGRIPRGKGQNLPDRPIEKRRAGCGRGEILRRTTSGPVEGRLMRKKPDKAKGYTSHFPTTGVKKHHNGRSGLVSGPEW